jgi:glycosyltransferase involved in cell wall biosynthesis
MGLKISVIIPIYNDEKYIAKCLEYVVHQTYKNLEIIIVNDGSTDQSYTIVSKYAKQDKRIKIMNQKNSGPANARNNGLKHATGDYVHFHDSDDYVELNYYEKMVHAANTTHADILCGEVGEIGFYFPKFPRMEILMSLEDKILKTWTHRMLVVWRYLYRREFLSQNNLWFSKDMFVKEDSIFSMTAAYYARNIATVPGVVYHCIANPTSLGHAGPSQTVIRRGNNEQAWMDFLKFRKDHGIDDIIQKSKLSPPDKIISLEFMHMAIWKKKIWDDKTKYYLFGLEIFSKRKFPYGDKTKYYLFGIYVFRIC